MIPNFFFYLENILNIQCIPVYVLFSACKATKQSPLEAGDKVIEVNGVLVTDETIQEVRLFL